MIIPCIDLMGGKVVQLVQGREKVLEAGNPLEILRTFNAFHEVQVIDLDAAMGAGANEDLVRMLAARVRTRVGGGVRTVARALRLTRQGACKVIVGTSAFTTTGVNEPFLSNLAGSVGKERLIVAVDSIGGRIVINGWRTKTDLRAEDVLPLLQPYCSGFLCTFVDKEGMLKGTDLEWFRRLRAVTDLELTAAGGITTMQEIQALLEMNVNAALGMAIYTGQLSLAELAKLC